MGKRIILLSICFLIYAFPARAKFDPSYQWTTLETPHFHIHYHQAGESTARKAARIAEDIHGRLVARIRWEPKQRTHIVLVDAMDVANGYTSPIPYNHMVIFLTHPVGETSFGSTSYDDWLRFVLTHEYAHVLQLDMMSGVPDTIQSIFGRIYFPNMWQPVFFIEGLATFEETEQTSGGRGRSPGADMVLRMAALEGPFPSIDQASVYIDSWPSGQTPYLFGESFTRYLADKYGRERLAELSIAYGGRGLPFLVQSTGRRILGRSYVDLWFEWEVSLKERYRKEARNIKALGLTPSRPLTNQGYYTINPAYAPDGKHIAYSKANGNEFPAISVMNVDGSGDRTIVENVFPLSASGSGVSWAPDGSRLYYTKLEIRRNTNFYADIYAYDLRAGKEIRVTKGLRARDPHLSGDGTRLLFVTNRMGLTKLAVLNDPASRRRPAREQDVAYLTEESRKQYSAPRWSPDGTSIAVTVWQPGGNVDVWLLDASGAKRSRVTDDRAIEGSPVWSPDGKHLLFSSDRSGVFNLYAYEIETGSLFQVTNVIGGAFTPSISPDGNVIAFSSYSAQGYDIHTMPIHPGSWRPAKAYQDRYPRVQYDNTPVEVEKRSYSPLPTIYPRFWLPWFGYSQESGWLFGGFTYGQDIIQRHRYYATLLYGPKKSRTWYSLDYFYDGLFPTIYLWASDSDVTYGNLLGNAYGDKDYVERQQRYGGSVIIPRERFASQHYVALGYQWQNASALTALPPPPAYEPNRPVEGVFASGRARYLFNSSRRYDFSISREQGRTIALGYERFDESLGSDVELNKYTADWHEYINFPWKHHVLLVRGFAGSSTGDVIPQRAFQLGGDMPGDIALTIDEQTVHLRGYPANAFRGQKAALATLEYRFPLKNMEQGFETAPLFFRRVHGAVFAEGGNAWDGTFHGSDVKRAVGLEIRFDMYLAYYLPLTFRVGGAFGLDEQGESQLIIGLWVPFLL